MPSRATSATRIRNDIFGSDHCPVELEIELSAQRPRRGAVMPRAPLVQTLVLRAATTSIANVCIRRESHNKHQHAHAKAGTVGQRDAGKAARQRVQALATANRRGHRSGAVGRNGDQVRRSRRGVPVLVRICKAKIDRAVALHNRRRRARGSLRGIVAGGRDPRLTPDSPTPHRSPRSRQAPPCPARCSNHRSPPGIGTDRPQR